MKLIPMILFTFATQGFAEDCINCSKSNQHGPGIASMLASVASAMSEQNACDAFAKSETEAELKKAIYDISLIHNEKLKPAPKNRHEVGLKLNDCTPESNSKGLVISFAGTGSYDPRSFDLMTRGLGCLKGKQLPKALQSKVYSTVQDVLHSKGKKTKWSAIEAGPITQMYKDEYLASKAHTLDFASFPSEESEMIADPEKIGIDQMKKAGDEISRSVNNIPKGIENALECTSKYLKKAAALKIKPKIIVLSHSSGGRSAVKFAEQFKKVKERNIDLTFSIDPVIEAHEALKEVASQYGGKVRDAAIDSLPFVEKKNTTPVNIWTRDHGDKLHKPGNVDKWVSVYQSKDKEGIKGPVKFGIHGSKIANADLNQYISDGLGTDAHGAIAYHDKTKELFKKYMKELLK